MLVACCIVWVWLDSGIDLGKHKKWQQHGGGPAGRISYPSEPCTGRSQPLLTFTHLASVFLFPCIQSLMYIFFEG